MKRNSKTTPAEMRLANGNIPVSRLFCQQSCPSASPSSLQHWCVHPALAGNGLTTHHQDRTIVGVAVPAISNQFHSFDQIAWYESAFLFTNCAFQLPMGKAYVRPGPTSPPLSS